LQQQQGHENDDRDENSGIFDCHCSATNGEVSSAAFRLEVPKRALPQLM
jgi:hypothetical protein